MLTDPEHIESIDASRRLYEVDAAVTEWLRAARKMIRESEGGSRRPSARDAPDPGSGFREERS